MMIKVSIQSVFLLSWIGPLFAFQSRARFLVPSFSQQPASTKRYHSALPNPLQQQTQFQNKKLYLFDKLFEEEGILGKGVTVGKVQVALTSPDRGPDSIFGILEREANNDKSLPELTHAIALALLRKSDDWVGAAGTSDWFSQNDAGKAESRFNDLANAEAAKFEKVRS